MNSFSMSQLGRNTALYTLAGLIQRSVGFLLLPVYTRFLSKSDYGVMQLLDISVDIAAILFVAGMTTGLQRYYFATESPAEKERIVATAFVLEMALATAAAAMLFVAAPLVPYIGLHEPQHVAFVRIAAVNFLLSVLSSVPLLMLQVERRAGSFFAVTVVKLVIQVTLNLVFVVGLDLGVAGILYSAFISNALVGAVLAVWLVRRVGLRFDGAVVRKLRSFGVPYQVSTAGTFILAFGDRFFLARTRTIGEVGVYGLAYQFGFLLGSLVEVPFFRAWNPMRFLQVDLPRSERDASYNRGVALLSVVLAFVASAIVLFTPPVIAVATTKEFHSAAAIVPLIIAAYVMQCFTTMVSFGIDVSTRTKYVTYATWASVLVVVVLYATLIPPFGAFGAAWATLVAFIVRFGVVYFFAQRLWPVSYEWGYAVRALGIGGAVEGVRFLVSPSGVLEQLGLSAVLLAICALSMWSVALRRPERQAIILALRNRWERSSGSTHEAD